MKIELKPQLRILSDTELDAFVDAQRTRITKINRIIDDANKRIHRAVDTGKPDLKGLSIAEQKQMNSLWERNGATIRGQITREVDKELFALLKECRQAGDDAKIMGGRHYDKFSILRRATFGKGMVEAMQLRASYGNILELAGDVELSRWAQQAIDEGDAILADCVMRANDARPLDQRPFKSIALLNALPNGQYEAYMDKLNEVIDGATRAGMLISEFETGRPDSFRRIQLGLAQQARINGASKVVPEGDEAGA